MRALGLLPILLLGACALDPTSAHDVLREEGFDSIEVSAVDFFDRPCLWSHSYAARFVAKRDGRTVAGVVCAVSEAGQSPTFHVFDVEERWRLKSRGAE